MKRILLILLFLLTPSFVFASGTVEINTAPLQQLETLTGIGPVKAQAIINSRPFSSIDDLLKVSGIGQKTLQKIEAQGFAYVSGSSSTQTQPVPQPVAQTTSITYPAGVFINEVLPNPKGADETDEWIELHNSNNFDVDLAGWQLQDKEGTATIYTIPIGTKILANGFLVFKRPETQIMLNNDKDGLNLLAPDGKIIDSMSFATAPLGQSYNKNNSGLWQWSATLTPGEKNIISSITKNPSTSSGPNGLSKTNNSVKNNGINPLTADLSLPMQAGQTKNPWFLFFTVLAITIILAILVLLIKLKIFKKHVRT